MTDSITDPITAELEFLRPRRTVLLPICIRHRTDRPLAKRRLRTHGRDDPRRPQRRRRHHVDRPRRLCAAPRAQQRRRLHEQGTGDTAVLSGDGGALALAVSGASGAFVFDHLVRKRHAGFAAGVWPRSKASDRARPGRVHCDFTVASARRRLLQELGESAAGVQALQHRQPMAFDPSSGVRCAARGLRCAQRGTPPTLVASDIFYPDRQGEIYQVMHRPTHQWWYFPAMTRDEVLIFKQFDSAPGPTASYTPHAAFEHPATPANTPLRESIEIRCLLIYEGDKNET
jgi:hypothetical protein